MVTDSMECAVDCDNGSFRLFLGEGSLTDSSTGCLMLHNNRLYWNIRWYQILEPLSNGSIEP
jgi:hypothetical protein